MSKMSELDRQRQEVEEVMNDEAVREKNEDHAQDNMTSDVVWNEELGEWVQSIDVEYEDKDINNMILYLRINKRAEMQYIDNDNDLNFYDYMSGKHINRKALIRLALNEGWKLDWQK